MRRCRAKYCFSSAGTSSAKSGARPKRANASCCSGGWSAPRPGKDEAGLPATQLFDLAKDIGEKTNVADKHPEVVARLTRQLEKWVADGRSSPGAPQKNTTPVEVRKR